MVISTHVINSITYLYVSFYTSLFVVLTYNESGTTNLDNALVFNRFGRLAVGDDNPTEKLDVRGNIKSTGSYIGGTQSIASAGAINVTTLHTEITSSSVEAYTLADGVAGQLKTITMFSDHSLQMDFLQVATINLSMVF